MKYVQKLYSTNKGTDLISVTQNGKDLVGQDELYASATLDSEAKEVVVKVVNTSSDAQEIQLNFKGKSIKNKGKVIVLKEENLTQENSFDAQEAISPSTEEVKVKGDSASYEVAPYSLNIIRIPVK